MKTRNLILPMSLGLVFLMLTACSFSDLVKISPPDDQPLSSSTPNKIAIYSPQPAETPSTPLWQSQSTCESLPLYQWREAGTFTWHFSYPGYDDISTITQAEAVYAVPGDSACGWLSVGVGEILETTPEIGANASWSGSCQTTALGSTKTIVQQITISVSGWEQKTTQLGTFRALRVKSLNQYADGTTPGVVEVTDWYVCGYGRIYSESIDVNTDIRYVDELVSFTPQSTNESHVRYILADMQLINSPGPYRSRIDDEETAEALRRWDIGIRVINIEQFERRNLNGDWFVISTNSEIPINGTDVKLTSDPQL